LRICMTVSRPGGDENNRFIRPVHDEELADAIDRPAGRLDADGGRYLYAVRTADARLHDEQAARLGSQAVEEALPAARITEPERYGPALVRRQSNGNHAVGIAGEMLTLECDPPILIRH